MPFVHTFDAASALDHVRGPRLSVSVRHLGAEPIALTLHHPTLGDVGLLWRNGLLDPPPHGWWKSHAPILFPAVGGLHENRSRTRDGTPIRFNRLHGFARERIFARLAAEEEDGCFLLHYHLADSDETRAMYPWRFALDVFYRLWDDRLEQTLTVTNRDDRPMPFQIGWHPGFGAPLVSGRKADCRLVLPQGKVLRLGNDSHCFLTGEREEVTLSGEFRFTEAELERTYMFDLSAVAPKDRVVSLSDHDGSPGVRVCFPDYPHLGLWSDAGAPFLCIEPWQGMDDHVTQEPFDEKFGIVLLAPGEQDTRCAWVEVVA